jgi:RND family efflux transporter MFP subunit
MPLSKKVAALAAGFVAALSLGSLGQNTPPAQRSAETLVLNDATVDWIEKSDVAALREGVIATMELKIGMPVKEGGVIGSLHDEIAKLTVRKAQLAASGTAAEKKAVAQKELAESTVATNIRLNKRNPGMVSQEEMRKNEAEVKVADAMQNEALEKREVDKAELALAERTLEEHTIVAPFDGIVLERLKNRGESVRANEAVVRLGNLDKLRAWTYIPLSYYSRVKEGQVVELQPRLHEGGGGAPLPIEQRKFRGKITFIDPEIQAVAEDAVRIYAEFDNKDHELRPGLKATMTIFLTSEPAAVGTRTVRNGVK